MRLIDADALKESMGECPLNWNDSPEEIQEVFDWNNFTQLIDDAPTIKAEPVRYGHWEPLHADSKGYTNHWNCSECSRFVSLRYNEKECEFDYCPHCGAKMDEVSE